MVIALVKSGLNERKVTHVTPDLSRLDLCTYQCNVKALGGGGGGSQGMGWEFDIFEKFAVKFPAHGKIIPVKCNQISPPRAAHRCQISQGRQRKIQIFPPPGEQGQSNALPQGQTKTIKSPPHALNFPPPPPPHAGLTLIGALRP